MGKRRDCYRHMSEMRKLTLEEFEYLSSGENETATATATSKPVEEKQDSCDEPHSDYSDESYSYYSDHYDESSYVPIRTGTGMMTYIQNLALTHRDSGSALLTLFSQGGALRQVPTLNIVNRFKEAWKEDALLTMKCLFYLRDIRGKGQGERRTFRVCLEWLKRRHPEAYQVNLDLIPHFGRWDDLWAAGLEGPCSMAVLIMIQKQFEADMKALKESAADPAKSQVSLLAKWLPSENASSKKTIAMAKTIREYLKMSPAEYRRALSALRRHLNIVERLMSAKKWPEIDYSHVPSRANLLYRKAFFKHDAERYNAFIEKVKTGTETINAATLYPYDVIREVAKSVGDEHGIGRGLFANTPSIHTMRDSLEAMWRALPDFLAENPHNGLVVPDVSGSMYSTGHGSIAPIYVAVSLAIYFAQRSKGYYSGRFLEFTSEATLREIKSEHICDVWRELADSPWGGSTNLQSAFDVILSAAIQNKVPKEEMPTVLYIISDMQFNQACTNNDKTNLEVMQCKYEQAGYPMPQVCFWNVNAAYGTQTPAVQNTEGVIMVSGCSPSIFSMVMNGTSQTPYQFMVSVLSDERYAAVRLP